MASLRYRGIVKWFNSQKGFGMITREDNGKEIFAHKENLREGFTYLKEGEPVEFSIKTFKKIFGSQDVAEDIASLARSRVSPDSK